MRITIPLASLLLAALLAPIAYGAAVYAPAGNTASSDQCAQMNGHFSAPQRCWVVEGGGGKFYVYALTSDNCDPIATSGVWEENGKEAGLQTKGVTRDDIVAATCWPWLGP